MHGVELILILLAAVTLLATIADRLTLPYPILLVLGGLILGLIPHGPSITLNPELLFVLFLPPILFAAAYDTSWRDFRANLRPISLLAIGCVLFTTVVVALIAHATIPNFSWPAAFVLGAIVAPPDAAAATAIFQYLGVPRRLVTILEGESLVNDASALVTLRFAVAAVVSGSFSLTAAGISFVIMALGGIVIGIAAGWLLNRLLPLLSTAPAGILASLLAPAAIYLLAENLQVSGVLATVVAGLVHGRSGPIIFDPLSRVFGATVWKFAVFLVNGLVFILIGLQLRGVMQGLNAYTTAEMAIAIGAIIAAVILVRIIWVFPTTYLPRLASRRLRERDPAPPWQIPAILSWAGLRGGVSLAAALALPLETAAGAPFAQRNLIIFLTFTVILATLVGQGLTLAPLVRRLGIGTDDEQAREEVLARRTIAEAALQQLTDLTTATWVPEAATNKLQHQYQHQLSHLPASLDPIDRDDDHIAAHRRLRNEIISAQRVALIDLRNRGLIADDILRRVQRDLDLEELRPIV